MYYPKLLLLALLFPLFGKAFNPTQNSEGYQAHINLQNIVNQRVEVTIVVPLLNEKSITYNMPKIVPGTYKIYDFGQFVHQFKALDSRGNELQVTKLNQNQWQIDKADELYKITYWASASFNSGSNIFAPAGTSISSAAFLLNNFGFIGYLQGYKSLPFTLKIEKPKGFYGTTSLHATSRANTTDQFVADNYFQLHDCPILYALPDTATIQVAGIPVRIGVYSPEGNIKAERLAQALQDVFTAAANYLGGTLPTDKYTIIVYGIDLRMAMNGTGALEHHTSTVLTMPDVAEKMLAMFTGGDPMQIYRDIVAHEFFHIVTPLNIHARQINDFDFINPQMSEHLWLYEGVTEYNSMISQARAGIKSLDDFMDEVRQKMEMAHQFNEQLPFTQTSKYALTFFGNQYMNVYQKGALIGLALDLKLRKNSEGEYGLINLLEDLWQTYGQDTFFVDDQLFEIMANTSGQADLVEFFARHVAGCEPLPFEALFANFGIEYQAEKTTSFVSTGGIKLLAANQANGMVITIFDTESDFANALGIKKYDVLTSWNGTAITSENGKATLRNWAANAQPGDEVTVEVLREVRKGKWKKIICKAQAGSESSTENDAIGINNNLTESQRNLRTSWINQ